ncbi:MAG: M23 family metallopeptidase, partial [Deltaproteobacteria bacterium]|nr:M23 family metallopeptidase [Deltaproteobacteria bacterium]
MGGTIKLKFLEQPTDAHINKDGGEFGAPRPYGPHIGVDYLAYLNDVKAIEDGKVVYSGTREGSIDRANYGNTIVIDHTPDAGDRQRHIYSLYAHLSERKARTDQMVKREEVIGISGNTGTIQYYKGIKLGFHLHFEIIDTVDSPKKFDWSMSWPLDLRPEHRKDPMKDYLGQTIVIDYSLTDEEMDKFYAMIRTDFRTTPRPRFLVGIPEYGEVVRNLRGQYPPIEEKPPKVKLRFKNMFSPAFRAFFPSVGLEVNGKSLGSIQ